MRGCFGMGFGAQGMGMSAGFLRAIYSFCWPCIRSKQQHVWHANPLIQGGMISRRALRALCNFLASWTSRGRSPQQSVHHTPEQQLSSAQMANKKNKRSVKEARKRQPGMTSKKTKDAVKKNEAAGVEKSSLLLLLCSWSSTEAAGPM